MTFNSPSILSGARRIPFSRSAAIILLILLIGCGAAGPREIETVDSPDPIASPCQSFPYDHAVFSIVVDGVEVGREVRSSHSASGPFGQERINLSHEVLRMKMGAVEFDRYAIRSERLLSEQGTLLRGSHVSMDRISVRVSVVGYDGQSWSRLVEKRSSVTDPPRAHPLPLALAGDEIIGLDLIDHLRSIADHRSDSVASQPYYDPLLDRPVSLSFTTPEPGTTDLDGQTIEGFWVSAIRNDTKAVVLRALFDTRGTLWEERYPTLHQVRRRIPGHLSLLAETSALLVGLRSEAYLGLPNSATRAVFRLRTNSDRIATLSSLGDPSNQTLTQIAADELRLEVRAGAPDGDSAPIDADLGESLYIKPDAPQIRNALRYLRSAGRRGKLSEVRRDNATVVIAQVGLIRNPTHFWRDPDKVAGLIMRYVNALLPDKRHTFSMADAVNTLENGAGDCTEHSVLFASLMRAQGIPTRLVAGLYLTRGGLWGYHMWAAYWNGSEWQSIDPGNSVYRPGAIYVALGRGASTFSEVREDIAKFIDRTFSGVAFDLIEAFSDGNNLSLARPRVPGEHLPETALFNAVVLSGRGDHAAALDLIDTAIPPDQRPLRIKLMRIKLLVLSGQHDLALQAISDLRPETSSPDNTYLLDTLEMDSLLTTGQHEAAASILARLTNTLQGDKSTLALFQAQFQFGSGEEDQALSTLADAIAQVETDADLLTAIADYTSRKRDAPSAAQLATASENAQLAILQTMAADHRSLLAIARVLVRQGRTHEALQYIEHALILAPSDRDLLALREKTAVDYCQED